MLCGALQNHLNHSVTLLSTGIAASCLRLHYTRDDIQSNSTSSHAILLNCPMLCSGSHPYRRICSIHVLKEMIYCIKEVSLWENGLLEIQFGIDPVRARNWSLVERKKCLFFPPLTPKHVSVNSIGHRIKQSLSYSAITERNNSVQWKATEVTTIQAMLKECMYLCLR